MARALDYAHGRGFVHRDVKPENILFAEDGTPRLTDFGIARAMSEGTGPTKTGMVIGSPHYMSPEQARGLRVDGRSDLYSLGVVFHEMLTGRVPFEGPGHAGGGVLARERSDPVACLPGLSLGSRLWTACWRRRRRTGSAAGASLPRCCPRTRRKPPPRRA